MTLWNQQGSRVIWGTLLVIPINESLLYVRPLYLQAQEGRIPELKQVIVAYQNRIEMAETLTLALGRVFGPTITAALAPDRLSSSATSVVATPGGEAVAPPAGGVVPRATAPAGDTVAALAAEMRGYFQAADKALSAGNLAGYEAEIKKIRAALERLERIKR